MASIPQVPKKTLHWIWFLGTLLGCVARPSVLTQVCQEIPRIRNTLILARSILTTFKWVCFTKWSLPKTLLLNFPAFTFFSVSYSSIQFLFYHWYYKYGLLLFMWRNVTCKCKRESWDMMSSRTWTVIEGQIWEDVRGELPKTGNYLRRRDQSWRQGSSYHPLTPGYRHQKLKSDE